MLKVTIPPILLAIPILIGSRRVGWARHSSDDPYRIVTGADPILRVTVQRIAAGISS